MLLSCATFKQEITKLPDFISAWQIQVKNETPSAKNVSQAMIIFYNRWSRQFGDKNKKVLKALNGLMIEWSTEKKTVSGFDINGQYVVNAPVVGATLSPGYIWLYVKDNEKVYSSSLIHELVHVAIWAQDRYSNGDHDHEGVQHEGWTPQHTLFIYNINNLLKKFDL
jgi:hypothetical protein